MANSIPEIILKKRNGLKLTNEEINIFVKAVADESIQESQIGAMLMAIYFKDFDYRETAELTKAMVESGETLDFDPSWSELLVDKHSTGGVGDKISLVLAPALAACGLKVPMVSGRGLAHTGGTLDKLESIPGFKVQLTAKEMSKCLEEVGCFIAGATTRLAPADRVLYKHRDVTSTVDSIPLMTSSILSKKAAEGTRALVMDIKVGRGAFAKNIEYAQSFAETLIRVAKELNVETRAVLSEMDVPIGRYVGNALEVFEAVQCLKYVGSMDVIDLVATLGGLLLLTKGQVKDLDEGEVKIRETLQNGTALEKFQRMLALQGVASNIAETLCTGDPYSILPKAPYSCRLSSKSTGVITDIDAIKIAHASWALGAGRSIADEPIDYSVGIQLIKTVGDYIQEGEDWVKVYQKDPELKTAIKNMIQESIEVKNDGSQHTINHKSRIIQIL